MALSRFSRYRFCRIVTDPDGTTMLEDRSPWGFRDLPDNIRHLARLGDTWSSIAAQYYRGLQLDRPEVPNTGSDRLWWVVADFQPEPVYDPTIAIEPGTTIHLPSARTVLETIFSEKRRVEAAEGA